MEVLLQDKDGGKTPLSEALAQHQIRSGNDLGGSRCQGVIVVLLLVVLALLLLFCLLFLFVLLAAFSDPLVAQGDEIGGIFFHPERNTSRKPFQRSRIVSVLSAKVFDSPGRVLRQLERPLIFDVVAVVVVVGILVSGGRWRRRNVLMLMLVLVMMLLRRCNVGGDNIRHLPFGG